MALLMLATAVAEVYMLSPHGQDAREAMAASLADFAETVGGVLKELAVGEDSYLGESAAEMRAFDEHIRQAAAMAEADDEDTICEVDPGPETDPQKKDPKFPKKGPGGDEILKQIEDELENIREDINPRLSSDDFSIKGSIPGDPKAYVRAETNSPGIVEVTNIFRGNLPKGSAGEFLAKTLTGHNAVPSEQLVFKNITNQPTLDAFTNGMNPTESVLGRTGTNALNEMGLTPSSYRFEVSRGKLNLIIGIAH